MYEGKIVQVVEFLRNSESQRDRRRDQQMRGVAIGVVIDSNSTHAVDTMQVVAVAAEVHAIPYSHVADVNAEEVDQVGTTVTANTN